MTQMYADKTVFHLRNLRMSFYRAIIDTSNPRES